MLGNKNLLSNQIGQSVLEYVLLLAVVAFFSLTIFRSSFFGKIFGNQSVYFDLLKASMEHGYYHAFSGKSLVQWNDQQRYEGPHSSYIGKTKESRFFYAKKYPQSQ